MSLSKLHTCVENGRLSTYLRTYIIITNVYIYIYIYGMCILFRIMHSALFVRGAI